MQKTTVFGNLSNAWLCFYVHFATEVTCFFNLTRLTGDDRILWLIPLIYDLVAFFPQGIAGGFSDRYKKFPLGTVGSIIMAVGTILYGYSGISKIASVIVLCTGNCLSHVDGAEITLRCCAGKLTHSALFVAGGSFGLITGKLLAQTQIPCWAIALFMLSAIPFSVLGNCYRREADKDSCPCRNFNYTKEKLPAAAVVAVATAIVIVRGYMGYGIPTSWKKSLMQTVLLYCAMGLGKAFGGICSDVFGVKKTALVTSAGALPFLIAGNNHMFVSLVGITLFSMTMSITLAMAVSAMKQTPGIAFGFTTAGLFFFSFPVFFFTVPSGTHGTVMLCTMTALCFAGFAFTLKKDNKELTENENGFSESAVLSGPDNPV